jgi:hypothetical protein
MMSQVMLPALKNSGVLVCVLRVWIDEAARAIGRSQKWKIVPEGAWAANLLGLSTRLFDYTHVRNAD